MNSPAFARNFAPADFDRTLSTARIGEIMVRQGTLSPQDIAQVLRVQHALGSSVHRERFGEIVIRLGLASRASVERALSEQLDYPLVECLWPVTGGSGEGDGTVPPDSGSGGGSAGGGTGGSPGEPECTETGTGSVRSIIAWEPEHMDEVVRMTAST